MQYNGFAAVLLAAVALPAAEYSTYIGDQNAWDIRGLIVDAFGNTYVAGGRTFNLSHDPLRPDLATEAIVAKLDTSGKTVLFAGFGGKGNELARALALDRAGNIYIAGSTSSPNLPLHHPLFATPGPGFVVKFNPDATEVLYATYFPAAIEGLAVDHDGGMYVTGLTSSNAFPTTPGLPKGPLNGGIPFTFGAFLTKIVPFGDKIAYSTVISGQIKNCGAGSSCFTGSRGASPVAVGLDAAGNAYLAGNSDVTDLPTTGGGFLSAPSAGPWMAKVNASGTALAYLVYLGLPSVHAMAVDADGNAFIAASGAFAVKVNPAGTAMQWRADISAAEVTSTTLDAAGNFWVSGTTHAEDFPNQDGWSTGNDFVVRFDPAGKPTYSARYPTGSVRQIAAGALLHTSTGTGVISAVAPAPRPVRRPWTIGAEGGRISAGQLIEIFGPHIGGPGAGVFFNDIPARILYSGDQQINAIVPLELEGQKLARVRIDSGPDFTAAVLPAFPQIFSPALNQDGTANSLENPAPAGSIMTIWVTGTGQFPGALFTANGVPIRTLYSSSSQINFVAPDYWSVVLTARDYASPPFPIYVSP